MMTRRTISSAATATLEQWLDQLQEGALHIGELPLAVEAWLHAGYAMGRESRDAEVAELEHQANRWYYLATVPERDRNARVEARLGHALEVADENTWQRIEQDLHAMRGQQKNSSLGAAAAAIGDETCQQDIKTFGKPGQSLPPSVDGHKHAA